MNVNDYKIEIIPKKRKKTMYRNCHKKIRRLKGQLVAKKKSMNFIYVQQSSMR